MRLSRFALVFPALFLLAGCASLGFSKNEAGVKIVGKQNYCGTASQASDVHYFATDSAFENWVSYRDIGHWHENVPPRGLAVVEVGQRPTSGYTVKLDNKKTRIENGVLNIVMNWHAPRLDAAVGQAMTTECVAIALPQGNYQTVKVLDQLGNPRGQFAVKSDE